MSNDEGMTKHENTGRSSSSFAPAKPGALRAPHVGTGAGIDLHRLAFLNKERNVDGLPGLEHGRLRNVGGGITAQTFRRFSDFQLDRRRQLDLDSFSLGVKHLDRQILDEITFGVAQETILERDGVVRLRIHEMVSVVVLVTELERGAIDVHQLDYVG